MKTLLDTCVVSAMRSPNREPQVRENIRTLDPALCYLTSISLGEMVYGIERLPASRRRRDLRSWLDQIEDAFTGRILPFDDEAARIWGKLKASGRTLPVEDAQIASIAIRFDLRIATRNTQDFDGTGANLINPWKQAL